MTYAQFGWLVVGQLVPSGVAGWGGPPAAMTARDQALAVDAVVVGDFPRLVQAAGAAVARAVAGEVVRGLPNQGRTAEEAGAVPAGKHSLAMALGLASATPALGLASVTPALGLASATPALGLASATLALAARTGPAERRRALRAIVTEATAVHLAALPAAEPQATAAVTNLAEWHWLEGLPQHQATQAAATHMAASCQAFARCIITLSNISRPSCKRERKMLL